MQWIRIVFMGCMFWYICEGRAQESHSWVFGLGFNVVDNSGTQLSQMLNIEDNWNISRLIKVSGEKRFEYDYGVELNMTLNEFTQGKMINSELNTVNTNYLAIDALFKNYTTNYFLDPRHSWYDGFLTGGAGGSFFDSTMNVTLNFGFGINFKINESVRFNFMSLAKFALINNSTGNANHFQHSVSTIIWM
ncbi:hypothetical protein HN014_03020 [Aquimarina sp. TRL1]|uniref:hypothetical protein n=1 Tax=Aquimarina sp. (strain TRL1) TaxID=2736252 RepID=UPI00158E7FD4|nr:hypothetical protein [Aquimarina sp. TRL1]QKX03919.1 hypothetical protein HN014_03020 [Aquimarina sp. TRL1]